MKLITHTIKNNSDSNVQLICCHGLVVLLYNLNRLCINYSFSFQENNKVLTVTEVMPDEHLELFNEMWTDIQRQEKEYWAQSSITYTESIQEMRYSPL